MDLAVFPARAGMNRDEGAVVEQGARHRVAWIRDGGDPWAVVLKRTRAGEVYVVSYRRAREQQVKKWRA